MRDGHFNRAGKPGRRGHFHGRQRDHEGDPHDQKHLLECDHASLGVETEIQQPVGPGLGFLKAPTELLQPCNRRLQPDRRRRLGQREVRDITIGEWVDFIDHNLRQPVAPRAQAVEASEAV